MLDFTGPGHDPSGNNPWHVFVCGRLARQYDGKFRCESTSFKLDNCPGALRRPPKLRVKIGSPPSIYKIPKMEDDAAPEVIPRTPSSGTLCATCQAAVEWGCDLNRQEGESYEVKKYHQSFDALQRAAEHCDLCRVAFYGAFLGGKSHFERELKHRARSAGNFEHYDLGLCCLGGIARMYFIESYKRGRSGGSGTR